MDYAMLTNLLNVRGQQARRAKNFALAVKRYEMAIELIRACHEKNKYVLSFTLSDRTDPGIDLAVFRVVLGLV